MRQSFVHTLGISVLALALSLPLGTVLCVHDGGHASLEAAALGSCTDDHDSSDHDSSSHRATGDHEGPGPCSDTLVGTDELKTATVADAGSITLAVAATAATALLPPSIFDPRAFAYRANAETTRWVTAFDSALRTTIILC